MSVAATRATGHKRVMRRYLLPFAALPLLASCVGPGPVAPEPAAPVATPPVRSAPAPAVVVDRYLGPDWSTDALSPGEWRLDRNSAGVRASFAEANGPAQLVIGCANGQVSIARRGHAPADAAMTMRVRSSFAQRDLSLRVDRQAVLLHATLPARDTLWDQISYSRGRFLVETSFQAPLIVPVRAAVARVIEDCRGS